MLSASVSSTTFFVPQFVSLPSHINGPCLLMSLSSYTYFFKSISVKRTLSVQFMNELKSNSEFLNLQDSQDGLELIGGSLETNTTEQ